MRTQPQGAARRTAHVPTDVDILDVIELIDEHEGDTLDDAAPLPPATPRPRVSWQALTVLVALGLGAVVVALRPWDTPPPWRTYPVPAVQPIGPGLLELADPPAPLMSAAPASGDTLPPVLGQLFATEGSTWDSGRWAMFTVASDGAITLGALDDPRFAEIRDAGSGRRVLQWWVNSTEHWTVTAHGLTDAEIRTFAGAVGVHDGHAALRSGYTLDDLEPLASAQAFQTAKDLIDSLGQAPPADSVSIARYRAVSTPTAVATNPGPADSVAAAQFLLGGRDAMVGDTTATTTVSASLGTMVAWMRDDRLVIVTGPVSPTEMVERAHGVRDAQPVDEAALLERTRVVAGRGTTADGRTWEAVVNFGRVTRMCAVIDGDEVHKTCTADAHATLLSTAYVPTEIGTVLVAFSNRDDPGSVLITGADGSTSIRRLVPLMWDISAVAVLVRPGEAYATVTTAEAESDRLQPPPAPTNRYVVDDPTLTPYSNDITTPLPRDASYSLWATETASLSVQMSRTDDSVAIVDGQRRVVDGFELVTPETDPDDTSLSMQLEDWQLTLRSHQLTDQTLIQVARAITVEDGTPSTSSVSATLGVRLLQSAKWESHLLYGSVESEMRSLTTDGDVITLRVGVATVDLREPVLPYLLDNISDEGIGWAQTVSGRIRGTSEHFVSWTENGRVLSLTGRVPVELLRDLRGSVRPAMGSEWDDLLEGLRPDFRLGAFATVGSGDDWEAGLQLAERAGRPEYLWWWTVPNTGGFTASVEVADDLTAGSPVVDTVVVRGATYVFVVVPRSTNPESVHLLVDGVPQQLSFSSPFSTTPFLAAVARVDTGIIEVAFG